ILCCAGSPVPVAMAQDTAASSDLEEKYDNAFQAMFQDPADLDKAFAFAGLAIQTQDFEGAIATLERMLLIDANLPRVRMELAVLYFRLGSFEVARGYFDEVLADKGAPEVVTKRVQAFLDKIDEQTSAHKVRGVVFAGLRHQSNANAGPNSTRVRVLGLDADLDSKFTNQADFDSFGIVRVSHSYDFGVEPKIELESELTLYGANQATQDQLDTSLAQIKTGPRLVIDPDLIRGLEVRPYLRWDTVNLAERQYYMALGGGIGGNYAIDTITRLSFDSYIVERTHNNTASSPSLTDLNGPRAAVSLSVSRALTPVLRASVSADLSREASADRGRRNWSYEGSATLTRVFDSPFPTFTGPWSVAGTVQAAKTIYDEPTASIDPDITREDETYSGQLVGTVQVNRSISLVTTGLYKKARSNLPNFIYDNWSFSVGLAVQF
ncbi:MAG: tetratricopeptide repeat protein, partial [Proteobacteria bacterium]|nr:tetratricopeptide repeat protein [Pseudomonadota bacterium]